MAIYDPRLFFSKEDRELLRLLALIVLEQEQVGRAEIRQVMVLI